MTCSALGLGMCGGACPDCTSSLKWPQSKAMRTACWSFSGCGLALLPTAVGVPYILRQASDRPCSAAATNTPGSTESTRLFSTLSGANLLCPRTNKAQSRRVASVKVLDLVHPVSAEPLVIARQKPPTPDDIRLVALFVNNLIADGGPHPAIWRQTTGQFRLVRRMAMN